MEVQAKANIKTTEFINDIYSIRGWQNFNISTEEIMPITDIEKWRIVTFTIESLILDTYLDIGCNLGLYPFTQTLLGKESTGYDYQIDYITECDKIATKLGLKTKFLVKSFSDINNKFDCITALGLIHHLYHRTETFGSLNPIMKKFADITNKYLIIEFPTEEDTKAKKWTNIDGRIKNEEYNISNFIKYSEQYFSKINEISNITKYRHLFLLEI